jgi:ABC-type multidrug transport system fused ATPase/permease subunit
MENYYEPFVEENKRPGFLTLLCVLTFIGSGFTLLSNLITPIFTPMMLEMLQNSSPFPGALDAFEKVLETPIWQFYLSALFCATSVLGAIYMLKMKKIGFHIYVISQLTLFVIGQFLIGSITKPNYFGLFLTLLFIGLYAIYYKKFTNIEEPKELES